MDAVMTTISSDGTTPLHEMVKQQEQVSITVKYPKDFKGQKWYKDCQVEHNVALNSAQELVEAGIATINKGSKEEEPADDDAPVNYKKMNKAELHALLDEREISYDAAAKNSDLVDLLENSDTES